MSFSSNENKRGSNTALDVLLAFIEDPVMTVPEVAARTSLPQSTAYRVVRVLRDKGLLTAGQVGQYHIGPRVFELVAAARSRVSVADAADPVMRELAQLTGETVLLTMASGDRAIAVHQVPGHLSVRLTFDVGTSRPLHAGASGKVLLAFLDERSRSRILSGDLERRTERTNIDPAALRKELGGIRTQGYAITSGEWDEGVLAIAAPIVEPDGTPWGISLVAPEARILKDGHQALADLMVQKAAEVTARLAADWNALSLSNKD